MSPDCFKFQSFSKKRTLTGRLTFGTQVYSHVLRDRRKLLQSCFLQAYSAFIAVYLPFSQQCFFSLFISPPSHPQLSLFICVRRCSGERVGPRWTTEAVLLVVIQPLPSSNPRPLPPSTSPQQLIWHSVLSPSSHPARRHLSFLNQVSNTAQSPISFKERKKGKKDLQN